MGHIMNGKIRDPPQDLLSVVPPSVYVNRYAVCGTVRSIVDPPYIVNCTERKVSQIAS